MWDIGLEVVFFFKCLKIGNYNFFFLFNVIYLQSIQKKVYWSDKIQFITLKSKSVRPLKPQHQSITSVW